MTKKIKIPRVLLTKNHIDHHDRGIKILAQMLRDEKMEVIYTAFGTPEDIFAMAVQEAVDVIGISFLSGGQVRVTETLLGILKKQKIDIPVFVGGTIRTFEIQKIKDMGAAGVFQGGESLDDFISGIWACVNK